MRSDLSIVVPAFNEEECLPILCRELQKQFDGPLSDLSIEVVVVDDHSNDTTSDVLKNLSKQFSWLRYIRLLRNSGSHIAIYAGLAESRGENAFIMGADLQVHPEVVINFVNEQKKTGKKLVIGIREEREESAGKTITSYLFNNFMSRFILKNYPHQGAGDGYFLNRTLIDPIVASREREANIFVLMLSLCDSYGTVAFKCGERVAGVSKWSYWGLMKLAYNSIVTVSYLPLQLIFWLGLGIFLLSILFIFYLVFAKLSGLIQVEGWTTLLIVTSGMGGLMMVSISVLGEYLRSNIEQTRTRPLFIVEDRSE